MGDETRLTRRAVLRGGGALGIALLVPLRSASPALAGAQATAAQELPRFLDEGEFTTLQALVDRFVPGPPEDVDPGALEAGCADAIDALLAAFLVDPPLIYAGAPFSDRAGAARNDFADFLPLDPYEEAAWRLKIEGSQGRADREFNGPVTGWQEIYRDGLAALDDAAPGDTTFADLPPPAQELVLRGSDDPAVAALVDVAFPHTLEFLYGAPEYGGNRDLVAWRYTDWDGDVQPRGWTREEVENPDDAGLTGILPELPASVTAADLAAIAPLASTEAAHLFLTRSDSRLAGLEAQMTALLGQRSRTDTDPGSVDAAIRAVADTIEEHRRAR